MTRSLVVTNGRTDGVAHHSPESLNGALPGDVALLGLIGSFPIHFVRLACDCLLAHCSKKWQKCHFRILEGEKGS